MRRAPDGPALRTKRSRARSLIRKMRQRRRRARPNLTRQRMSKRKAALAMSAGVMAMNTGMSGAASSSMAQGQPVTSTNTAVVAPAEEVRKHAALLTASDTFKEALIEEEGVRYTVYRDVAGYPTVGVGHLVLPEDNLRVGQRVSEDRVLEFLDQDIEKAEAGVRNLVGDLPLYQHEFDALVDLVFNVGEGNVSERKSPRLNAAIAAGDYEAIAGELHYHHAGGKKAKGLKYRSDRRAQIFMEASYDDPREQA